MSEASDQRKARDQEFARLSCPEELERRRAEQKRVFDAYDKGFFTGILVGQIRLCQSLLQEPDTAYEELRQEVRRLIKEVSARMTRDGREP
jgi:hypothetical protein